jgi:hypothetical protein
VYRVLTFSLTKKIDIVKQKRIAGVIIGPLNSDDIYNVCGYGDHYVTRQYIEAFKY